MNKKFYIKFYMKINPESLKKPEVVEKIKEFSAKKNKRGKVDYILKKLTEKFSLSMSFSYSDYSDWEFKEDIIKITEIFEKDVIITAYLYSRFLEPHKEYIYYFGCGVKSVYNEKHAYNYSYATMFINDIGIEITEEEKENINNIYPSGEKMYKIENGILIKFLNPLAEKAVIPDCVTTIGKSAFASCKVLKEIYIPDSVTIIEDNAFNYCENLKEVKIPDSVTVINNSLFYNCFRLEKVYLPRYVKAIKRKAFYGCSSLKEIKLPETVTTIGKEAFEECSKLTDFILPNSVKYIGRAAFYCCPLLNPDKEVLTIYGEPGSKAEEYARENDINFESLHK